MIRRIFDPERKVYAVKALTTLGVEFGSGEEIDWKAFDFPQRRVEMWFRLRLISHFPGGERSEEALAYYRGEVRQVHLTTGSKRRGRKGRKVEQVVEEPKVEEVQPEVAPEVTDEPEVPSEETSTEE